MEKISLLLLVAKKSLIGSVIAGVLGLGGITSNSFFNNEKKNDPVSKIDKTIGGKPTRPNVPQ